MKTSGQLRRLLWPRSPGRAADGPVPMAPSTSDSERVLLVRPSPLEQVCSGNQSAPHLRPLSQTAVSVLGTGKWGHPRWHEMDVGILRGGGEQGGGGLNEKLSSLYQEKQEQHVKDGSGSL